MIIFRSTHHIHHIGHRAALHTAHRAQQHDVGPSSIFSFHLSTHRAVKFEIRFHPPPQSTPVIVHTGVASRAQLRKSQSSCLCTLHLPISQIPPPPKKNPFYQRLQLTPIIHLSSWFQRVYSLPDSHRPWWPGVNLVYVNSSPQVHSTRRITRRPKGSIITYLQNESCMPVDVLWTWTWECVAACTWSLSCCRCLLPNRRYSD
ncbi:hypothetical protein BDZ97DRAFT_1119028 [Flammula alnicola]|nr:hypothetical protein BDZ97DRAFT_1119028 [Flammula alnicola]